MTVSQRNALQLRMERVIGAERERVFAAWTRPELLREWAAPEGMTVDSAELDVRAGGRWRIVMREPGGATHEAFGTYREVDPPARLVYTHAWRQGSGSTPETVVTVEFVAEGSATRVVLTQDGFGSAESRDGHRGGWRSSLNRLEGLLEGVSAGGR